MLQHMLQNDDKKDEWDYFTSSIASDLRFISHPVLKTSVKVKIQELISNYTAQQFEINKESERINSEV